MKPELIFSEGYNKYYRVEVPTDFSLTTQDDFDKLLTFIGENNPYKNRNYIGSAYETIKQKTNELLNIPKYNLIIKTSKREITSIKKFFEQKGEKYIKIPFKIEYIFRAIIALIDDLHNKGIYPPPSLNHVIGQTYALAFYFHHIDAYVDSCTKIPKNELAKLALADDFTGENSSLNLIFK